MTSAITLIAFAIAALVTGLRLRLRARERQLLSAPEAERPALVAALNDSFLIPALPVDSSKLTNAQAYGLLVEQIRDRSRRFYVTSILVAFLALVTALVATYALSRNNYTGNGIQLDDDSPLPIAPGKPAAQSGPASASPSIATPSVGQQRVDNDSLGQRALLISDLSEAYLDTGRKLAFFEDWGRPPTLETLRVHDSALTGTATDRRIVSMSIDPQLLPTPSNYSASTVRASNLTPQAAAQVARFFSSYDQFRQSLVALTSNPGDFRLAFISAVALARETTSRGHQALCTLGVVPPMMFPGGGFPEPVPPGCQPSPFS